MKLPTWSRRGHLARAATALGVVAALLLTAAPAHAYPNPGYVTGDINGVHDPGVVKAPNGTYIMISTNNWLEIRTSTDRTNWRRVGSVWNGSDRYPRWTEPYTTSSRRSYLWAPDITFRNNQYYLYYSASSFGSNRSAIFLATSPTAMPGTWTHRGLVTETWTSSNYNAIDPNLLIDRNGAWWLSLGSFWSGIKMVRINPSNGLRADSTVHNIASRHVSPYAIEAPFIYQHGSYYYLFVSFDMCCRGTSSTYRTMVGRSTSPTGPYVDRSGRRMLDGGGTEVLASHGAVYGPGHVAVIRDTDAPVIFYHYYYSNSTPDTGRLGINLLRFDSAGWPVAY